MIPLTTTTPIKTVKTAATKEQQQSSKGFGFWSLSSNALQSPIFSYKKNRHNNSNSNTKGPLPTTPAEPLTPVSPTVSTVIEKGEMPSVQVKKEEKKVSFQLQCQVRTFEVVALNEDFETSCQDDEEYWEQLGEDFWYQAEDFQAFKKDRRTLVDRIRTIGVNKAKGNYAMEGLEYFLTLKAREVHKERVLDGWVSVLEIQAEWEQDDEDEEGDCSQEDKVELIANKYAEVSKACIQDAHKRGFETAQEIQAEDEKLVASIPKSPQPLKKKASVQKDATKVKALGVWGNVWSTSSSSSSSKNEDKDNSFSTFQKIRPHPRQ
mmetsp:Transcript_13753/g.33310  ORF Transcript_13753/g.33310 Transcript_13753/m.33310 type:complete len:321 (-) Transcript_13753:158-1120(-)